MDVLYADCLHHAPDAQGIRKTKKQKVVRSKSKSSPISGISDDGCSSMKSGLANNKHPGKEGQRFYHGVPCVVLGGSTSTAGLSAVSFTTALSPSTIMQGSSTYVKCKTNPSNHHVSQM